MLTPRPRNIALILVVVGGATALALAFGGEIYVSHLLPLYRWCIETCFPHLEVQQLVLNAGRTEHLISLRAVLTAPFYVGAEMLAAGTAVSSATLSSHALLPLTVMLPLSVVAWLFLSLHPKRLVLGGMALLLLITMLDVPFVLVGAMEDMLYSQFAASSSPSLTMRWLYFLNGGGRLSLPVAFTVLLLTFAYRIPVPVTK